MMSRRDASITPRDEGATLPAPVCPASPRQPAMAWEIDHGSTDGKDSPNLLPGLSSLIGWVCPLA